MTKAKGNKASKAQNTKPAEAKAEDKAVVVKADDKGMTNAALIAALESVGVKAPSKAVKADLEKLYEEHKNSIELVARLPELQKSCLIKSFGSHGTSGLCPKCKKTQKAVYADCAAYLALAEAKKAAAKKIRKMGHRTGKDLWGTKKGTYANDFCNDLLKAGDAGVSMKEIRKAKWNPQHHSFNESADRLVNEGIAIKKDDRFYVTEHGLETSKLVAAA